MGGEHATAATWVPSGYGSSPRGRGTQILLLHDSVLGRIIPAWAGNTWSTSFASVSTPDHPRVGGEHEYRPEPGIPGCGSSPRGRGTLFEDPLLRLGVRIIPAWAGNTLHRNRKSCGTPDHPRVGGEHDGLHRIGAGKFGSSPRGRGTHGRDQVALLASRIIPAWAGNTGGSSRTELVARIIPAWAGNTAEAFQASLAWADHPRVGGEHLSLKYSAYALPGSSPRGRGTPLTLPQM